jgi:hypothetical protein
MIKKNIPQSKWGQKKKLNMQKPISNPAPNYGAGFAPNIKKIGP